MRRIISGSLAIAVFTALAAATLTAGATGAQARDNAPSDGSDAAFFLCMVEGGTEISIPLVGTLCCNPDWCVLCDTDLNNCREISAQQAARLQSRPQLFNAAPLNQAPLLAPSR